MHFCGVTNHSAEKVLKNIRKEKDKARADGHFYRQITERTPRKCF